MNLLSVLCGSIFQSSLCAFFSIMCVFPLMHMVQSFSGNVRSLFYSLFLMLAIMPGTVAAISVSFFYSEQGMIAIILAHLLLNIPLVFHLLYWDFIRIDYTLYPVARCLGASRMQSYYDGILRPLLASLISAFSVVFILCFSSASIPLLLGGSAWSNTLDSAIVLLHTTGENISIGLCIVLRAAVVLMVACLSFKLSNMYRISYKTVPFYDDTAVPVHKGWLVAGCGIMFGLLLPVMSLCVRFILRLPWYQSQMFDLFGESLFLILMRSFFIAVLSATTALGIALFFIYTRSRYATLFSTIPWLVGGSACAAFCALLASSLPIPSLILVVGCHALLCFPFIMRMITVALNQYDETWTLYAKSCGATRWQIFITLQLPYIKEALCASWSLSLGFSLAQVGVSQLLVDSAGMTLPVAIRMLKANGSMDGAIILSVCSMLLVFLPTFFAQWFNFHWNRAQPMSVVSSTILFKNSRRVVNRKRLQHST